MRRRAAQEPVEIDVLQKKKEELAKFVDQYNDAVSMVTGTVTSLESLNESIEEKIKEIDEYTLMRMGNQSITEDLIRAL